MVPEAAAPSLLPSGSVGPVVQPDGHSVLADAAPEAVAPGQPGPPAVNPLWPSAA